MVTEVITERLKEALDYVGLNQSDIARSMDKKPSFISKKLNHDPDLELILTVAKATGEDVSYLTGFSDESKLQSKNQNNITQNNNNSITNNPNFENKPKFRQSIKDSFTNTSDRDDWIKDLEISYYKLLGQYELVVEENKILKQEVNQLLDRLRDSGLLDVKK